MCLAAAGHQAGWSDGWHCCAVIIRLFADLCHIPLQLPRCERTARSGSCCEALPPIHPKHAAAAREGPSVTLFVVAEEDDEEDVGSEAQLNPESLVAELDRIESVDALAEQEIQGRQREMQPPGSSGASPQDQDATLQGTSSPESSIHMDISSAIESTLTANNLREPDSDN